MPTDFSPTADQPTLVEGETCWRKVHADRISFIVDAADYFAAAKDAILRAEKCVYLIGWEFDLEMRLRPGEEEPPVPDRIRLFLNHVVKSKPDLQIFVLQWDGAMLFNIARQLASFILLKTQAKPQIHFRLDNKHPAGACHHQKIIVIDDLLAFCGGIDMTSGRWDTPHHLSGDQRRRQDGKVPIPWHDMTLAVDGEAARVLGELARWRWKNATSVDLLVPDREGNLWPDCLSPDCREVTLGIARTCPAYEGEDEIREIERLWVTAIRSARRSIYIENQYLSSGKIAGALKAKLEEEDGPEIVIVLPYSAESWLETEKMDSARSLIISNLREADRHDRLGIYHPVNASGDHIYVHAKVILVDDRFIRIGSSNMSNRSMSLDTECDLALETESQPYLQMVIAGLRKKLLAEHLGTSIEDIEAQLERGGGRMLTMIERLRQKSGTTLVALHPKELSPTEKDLAKSRLLDPEEPVKLSKRLSDFARRHVRQNRRPWAAFVATTALAAGWAFKRSHKGR